MLTEEDKARVQKMRDMVEATHWIKGSLKRALEFEFDDEGQCKINPDTDEYIAGKWGHCIMGLVAVVCDINVRESDETLPFENRIPEYPQVARITEAMFDNLDQYWQDKLATYTDMRSPELVRKAVTLESFNDSLNTEKPEILELLDKTLAA